MSKLTDLRAALGKLVSAEERWESERTRKAALDEAEAWENMHDLLTCDTIAALVAVAGRAREHMEAWDSMEEAVNERHKVLYEEQHGQFISDQWKAELSAAIREANVVEHRTAEALAAALAQLVKEADHE